MRDASPNAPSAPSASATVEAHGSVPELDAAAALPPPRPSTVYGEWERQTEPYKGMRIALREGEPTALVTRSSSVDPTARNKAQLECQRSLWKPGDVMMTGLGPGGGTIIVRDWGLTQGVCRHRDTSVKVVFIGADEDNLLVSVPRAKTPVIQEWTRVPSSP